MPKSELVDAVREDYLKITPNVSVGQIDHFCAFLTNWLERKGIQGLGMAATGLTLRMADGSQLALITPDEQISTADTPAVGLNAQHREDPRRVLGDSPSVDITGR